MITKNLLFKTGGIKIEKDDTIMTAATFFIVFAAMCLVFGEIIPALGYTLIILGCVAYVAGAHYNMIFTTFMIGIPAVVIGGIVIDDMNMAICALFISVATLLLAAMGKDKITDKIGSYHK